MASTVPASDAAVREQAYLLWEQAGRPDGREMEFWTRAQVAVAEKEQMDTLTEASPKRKAKVAAKGKAAAASASAARAPKVPASKAAKPAAKTDGKDKPKKK